MAEEERKALVSGSERKNRLREEFMRRKRLRDEDIIRRKRFSDEEFMLRCPFFKAAHKLVEKFQIRDEEASVPAIGVSIGGYSMSRFTGKDVSVTACFPYGEHRLMWEIVEGPLRRRIVVHWNDIHGLELKLNECGLACLTVEVKCTPTCEIYTPKFKAWSCIRDFTDDEIWRNLPPHYIVFKPGTVDESYEKLLNYRKEQALLREQYSQLVQERRLGRQERAIFREKKLQRILEREVCRRLGKLSTSESEKEKNK